MSKIRNRNEIPILSKEKTGRWNSKTKVVSYDASFDEYFEHGFSKDPYADDPLHTAALAAKKYLLSLGLPRTAVVIHKGKRWFKEEPRKIKGFLLTPIHIYIEEIEECERDSLEQLAGLVVWHAHIALNKSGIKAKNSAYWAGCAFERFLAYCRLGSRPKRKIKPDLLLLVARNLLGKYPNYSSARLFQRIPKNYTEATFKSAGSRVKYGIDEYGYIVVEYEKLVEKHKGDRSFRRRVDELKKAARADSNKANK